MGHQLAVSSIEGTGHHVPKALEEVLGNGPGILGAGRWSHLRDANCAQKEVRNDE